MSTPSSSATRAWPVFLIFLRLGLTSFGGPVAHLGYFREEFVQRRRWFNERSYADLLALCQFLPGPASSQVGMAIGLSRAGQAGALAAWLGFTLPSALYGSKKNAEDRVCRLPDAGSHRTCCTCRVWVLPLLSR